MGKQWNSLIEGKWGLTMPAYWLDMWNNKFASSTPNSYNSCSRGTSTTLLVQHHAGERNLKPLLTSFLTAIRHFDSHPLLLVRNYHFWFSTDIFLMIRFKHLSFTRKQILTTTSIFLLLILTTANVLSLTVGSSPCVDFPPPTMTTGLNLRIWQHSLHSMVIRVLPLSMIYAEYQPSVVQML